MFVKILFAIILLFAGQHGTSPDDQLRLNALAQETLDVVKSRPVEELPIQGEAGVEATALVLVTIAGHEGGFWEKVQNCEACNGKSPWCDQGRSVSLYQLHVGSGAWGDFTRQQICESHSIATDLAMRILNRHRKASSSMALFKGYARGGRRLAAFEMENMFSVATRKAGIVVSYRDGGLKGSWLPGRKPVEEQDQNP